MKDYLSIFAALIGAIVVSFGWYQTGRLTRANNIHLKRLDYRIKALESFLPVWRAIEKDGSALGKSEIKEKLSLARESFHLYGTQDDVDLIEKLVSAVNSNNLSDANQALPPLVNLIKSAIRKELDISKSV